MWRIWTARQWGSSISLACRLQTDLLGTPAALQLCRLWVAELAGAPVRAGASALVVAAQILPLANGQAQRVELHGKPAQAHRLRVSPRLQSSGLSTWLVGHMRRAAASPLPRCTWQDGPAQACQPSELAVRVQAVTCSSAVRCAAISHATLQAAHLLG